jgi:MoaA/NifB/PqqE/SkfB family radical SAM enzyme
MVYEIADTSLMMVFLLEACDFSCPHCVRPDEPMERGYRLTLRQLRACLADCRRLPAVEWVHFSGGEPTLWREGDRDLADLLRMIADAGFVPGFTTHGDALRDDDACADLLGRYLEASSTPLRLYLSIDTFHGNFDPEAGRAPALDAVLLYREGLRGAAERLEANVLVTVSKDPASLLPVEMEAHYEARGARFIHVPLRCAGRAKELAEACPGETPAEQGAYAPFHRERAPVREPRGEGPATESSLILIGDDYHVLLAEGGELRERWRTVGRLGAIPDGIARQFASGA